MRTSSTGYAYYVQKNAWKLRENKITEIIKNDK